MKSWDDAENGTNLWNGLLIAAGAGAGAACVYLFDPARGSNRRSLLRDKIASRSLRRRETAPDDVLLERVRAKLWRWVSHPRAVDAYAINGRVTLRGTILKREVKGVLKAIGKVPGVQGVDNQLEQHERAGNIASLQGGRRRSSWWPTTRTIVGLLGSALAAYGAARRKDETKRFIRIGVAGRRVVDRPSSIVRRSSIVSRETNC